MKTAIDPTDPRGLPKQRIRKRRVGLTGRILLVIAVIVTFGWMIRSDILWTEFDTAERNAYVQLESWQDALTVEYLLTRELVPCLTYFAEKAIPLPTAAVHRSINIALHLTAAFLLLLFLQRQNLSGAYAATLVFALHPAVSQTLFWPGYRAELIGLCAILVALILSQQTKRDHYLLSIFATILAIFLHPAAVFLPAFLALSIYYREKDFSLENFNAVLPLICAVLLISAWMQSQGVIGRETSPRLHVWLFYAGQNVYFFLRQALYPHSPSLFYPCESDALEQASIDLSLLPFCLFLPFYFIAFIKLRQPWGRALLFGLTSFILLLLPGIQSPGTNLAGDPAHEDYHLYIALPPLIALIVCGTKTIMGRVAVTGRSLWYVSLVLYLSLEFINSANFSRVLGNPVEMWREQARQWPEQWIPSAALARTIQSQSDAPQKQREIKRILEALIKKHPDRTPERRMLLQAYIDTGENTNALREYRYILRETEPGIAFMKEAASFFDSINLPREAVRTRERIRQVQEPAPERPAEKPSAAILLEDLAGKVTGP